MSILFKHEVHIFNDVYVERWLREKTERCTCSRKGNWKMWKKKQVVSHWRIKMEQNTNTQQCREELETKTNNLLYNGKVKITLNICNQFEMRPININSYLVFTKNHQSFTKKHSPPTLS